MKSCYFCLFLASFLSLPCAIQAGRQSSLPNPEYVGVVYYLDPSAKLVALDRQVPHPKAGFKALGFGGAKTIVELDADKALLRLPSDQQLTFVVELASGVDPREFELYPFTVRNDKRQLVISSGVFSGQRVLLPIQINISRYGESSYKMSPSRKLPAGEYAFITSGSIEVFCFGVDKKK